MDSYADKVEAILRQRGADAKKLEELEAKERAAAEEVLRAEKVLQEIQNRSSALEYGTTKGLAALRARMEFELERKLGEGKGWRCRRCQKWRRQIQWVAYPVLWSRADPFGYAFTVNIMPLCKWCRTVYSYLIPLTRTFDEAKSCWVYDGELKSVWDRNADVDFQEVSFGDLYPDIDELLLAQGFDMKGVSLKRVRAKEDIVPLKHYRVSSL